MKTIKIVDYLLTRHFSSPREGDMINEFIKKLLLKFDKITIDFVCHGTITISFLNHAIGALLKDMSKEELTKRITFKVDEYQIDRINEVIDNAVLFYKNNP